jgi:hypothetical protein
MAKSRNVRNRLMLADLPSRRMETKMKTKLAALTAAAVLMMAFGAQAATLVNKGAAPVTIVVTEDGQKNEITAAPAETLEFCIAGCFVTFPDGDRQALTGSETVEISEAGVLIQ